LDEYGDMLIWKMQLAKFSQVYTPSAIIFYEAFKQNMRDCSIFRQVCFDRHGG
tara:strand:+ start:4566 stop:4724 length:159 start_codon:yes stop_codon:yes gene_type:complete